MNWRRGTVRSAMACVCVCVSLCAMLAACSTSPKTDDLAVRLALQEEVNEHLAAADKALKAGQTDQAMARLDAAVKADPASKAPWLRKAQIHFDAREYGQAITQAQEVLQRDVNDLTAKSILAVLGLDVHGGQEIVLRADGDGAEEVLERLAEVAATPEAIGA